MENLIGHTSGFAVPRYVIDAPGGGGKIPVFPNYLLTWSVHKVVLRNYKGVICTPQEPAHYERIFCNGDCDACRLPLNTSRADESKVVGVAKLLSDYDTTTTLTPENNDRINGGRIMQTDVVLHRGNSVVQHGHYNNRVYVMKLAPSDIPDIIRFADDLSARLGYSKIFVKVPESSVELFSDNGYVTEATVPFFFKGHESAAFMAKYHDPDRSVVRDSTVIHDVLSAAVRHTGRVSPSLLPPDQSLVQARNEDAEEVSALYRAVFESYPFPIFDPEYIRETMQGSIRVFSHPGARPASGSSCFLRG